MGTFIAIIIGRRRVVLDADAVIGRDRALFCIGNEAFKEWRSLDMSDDD